MIGRELIECWAGRPFADDDEYRRACARFYSAARANKVPAIKQDGVWTARRSTIEQYRQECLEAADRGARKRVGMMPRGVTPMRFVRAYDYVDENGVLLFQVVRWREPKFFVSASPTGGAAGDAIDAGN